MTAKRHGNKQQRKEARRKLIAGLKADSRSKQYRKTR